MWLSRKWPRINLYQKNGPSTIKVMSAHDLDRLMNLASDRRWSADGRPQWWAQHRDQFRSGTLIIVGTESSDIYRCIATIELGDRSGGRFTLDVSVADFAKLKDLNHQVTVEFAHRYLATFPPVDLDERQAKTWEDSVWKSWGRADS